MRLRLFFSLSDSPPLLILPGCCHGIVILDIQKRIPVSFFRVGLCFPRRRTPPSEMFSYFMFLGMARSPKKMCLFVLPSPLFLPPSCPLPSVPSPPPPPFPSVPFLLKKYLFFVFGREVGRGLQLGVNEKSNGTRPLWTGNLDHARHAFRCVNKATLNKT